MSGIRISIKYLLPMWLFLSLYSSAAENRFSHNSAEISISFSNHELNKAVIRAFEEDESLWEGGHLLIVAYSYLNEKDYTKATELLESLSNKNPDNKTYILSLGSSYQMSGNAEKAKLLYLRAWKDRHCLESLKQVLIMCVENNEMNSLDAVMFALLDSGTVDYEEIKCLLIYCCNHPDFDKGRKVADAVVTRIDINEVGKDPEMVDLLAEAYHRFYGANATKPERETGGSGP